MITVVCPWCEAGINVLKAKQKCELMDKQILELTCLHCKNNYYIYNGEKGVYEGFDLIIKKKVGG